MRGLSRYSDYAYALMRIAAGLMFSFHGAQKLFGILGTPWPPANLQMWAAGVIEFAGGVAIMLGIGTRLAAFLASGEMAVAYFQVHWKFQLNDQIFPIMNRGELAALYCFVFLYIATRGAVKWHLGKSR